MKIIQKTASAALICIILAGCAAMEARKVEDTEQLLSAAGFSLKIADTPERQAHLQTLTQNKIVPHPRDGKVYYVYADAKNNRLYVGDEQAYERFQRLVVEQRIADEQEMAAETNLDAAMDWGMWGPWW